MISIEDIIEIANANGATDVHLSVSSPPKMRIKGELQDMKYPALDVHTCDQIIKSAMNEAQKETLDKCGNIEFSYNFENIGRCRIAAFKHMGNLAASLRIVNQRIPNTVELRLPPEIINVYRQKSGLVLFAGNAGSGKSTVIASLIDLINENRKVHILTLEEPVEYIHQNKAAVISQREIGSDVASLEEGLKVAAKEDADVVYFENFSTPEVMERAMELAESGKLVISSVKTYGSIYVLERIIDSFPPDKRHQIRLILSNVLICIVSRKLTHIKDKDPLINYEILDVNEEIRDAIAKDDKQTIKSNIIYRG
ncbi:MAG: type IV pili twitching motility protein PilT [Lachnospiraceae bacterium]|nr:type IV pili twitching motility protein PilT [Lachnospiraceae bacterium]